MLLDPESLAYHRAKSCLSLRELAALSGISRDALSLYERGERNPYPSTVRRLAQALGIAPADLLQWETDDGE